MTPVPGAVVPGAARPHGGAVPGESPVQTGPSTVGGATASLPFASRGARVGCYLLDAALALALGAIAWWATHTWARASHPVALGVAVVLETALAVSLARAGTGHTPGGLALHCTAARRDEPVAPGLRRQAIRSAVQLGLQLTVIGPLVSAALSRDGQDWADRVSGLVVLDSRTSSVEAALQQGVRAPRDVADAHRAFMPAPAAPATREGVVASATGAAPSVDALDRAEARTRGDDRSRVAGVQPQVVSFTHQQRRATPQPEVSDRPVPAIRVPAGAPGDDAERTRLHPRATVPQSVLVDTGERVALASTLVVGRAPVAASGELAVPLADDSRSLSRTHLRIGRDTLGVWAEDAGSANGTALVVDGQPPVRLPAGRRVPVPVGGVLVLGDRRLTVVA